MQFPSHEALSEHMRSSWRNRVLPTELVLREEPALDGISRVLWLSSGEEDPQTAPLCLQVSLSPRGTDGTAWHDRELWRTQVQPVVFRLSAAAVPRGVKQYRLVQPGAYVYRDVLRYLQRELKPSLVNQLLVHNYVPEIDWRLFLRNAQLQGEELVCPWSQCRLVVAARTAVFDRQREQTRRSYAQY